VRCILKIPAESLAVEAVERWSFSSYSVIAFNGDEALILSCSAVILLLMMLANGASYLRVSGSKLCVSLI
jgi:hypothetical protein